MLPTTDAGRPGVPPAIAPALSRYLELVAAGAPGLLSDAGVQWAVLGICRLWYAFEEGEITSKPAAGDYVLARAPAPWRRILAEALAIRRGGEPGRYRSRLWRARDAAAFVGYAIGECKARFHLENLIL